MIDRSAAADVSSYMDYLPAIFRQDGDAHGVNFLGRFLLAFEWILSGPRGAGPADSAAIPDGFEQTLDRLRYFFDPGPGADERHRAPDEFLPWLAGWVALTLREDWTPEEQRRLISQVVPLYRLRGTRAGLAAMLATYTGASSTGASVEIHEFDPPAHYFQVDLVLPERNPDLRRRREQITRAIIDQEKPAHTFYTLKIRVPTIVVGQSSTVGVDTLVGS
jgi:phage tail-like protein